MILNSASKFERAAATATHLNRSRQAGPLYSLLMPSMEDTCAHAECLAVVHAAAELGMRLFSQGQEDECTADSLATDLQPAMPSFDTALATPTLWSSNDSGSGAASSGSSPSTAPSVS